MDGQALRTAREMAGYSQAELGSKIGVTMRTIGNWERGEHPIPRGKQRQIELLFGVTTSEDAGVPKLNEASDVELLSEIARRLGRTARSAAPTSAPGQFSGHGVLSAGVESVSDAIAADEQGSIAGEQESTHEP